MFNALSFHLDCLDAQIAPSGGAFATLVGANGRRSCLVSVRIGLAALLLFGAIPPSWAEPAERGALLYRQHCASCHGTDLEGEPGWQSADEDGRLRAPPHDQRGHTWMHGDAELIRQIRGGTPTDPALPTPPGAMPGFGDRLGDAEITAILSFIKSRWPPGHRAYQMLLNPDFDPAGLPPGDWRLPADCMPPGTLGKP